VFGPWRRSIYVAFPRPDGRPRFLAGGPVLQTSLEATARAYADLQLAANLRPIARLTKSRSKKLGFMDKGLIWSTGAA
jgi:hypothetical protein